tara:strand:+ start:244 stop:432 length:189 start_codon:yes stop_codon:yes gene_type:complete
MPSTDKFNPLLGAEPAESTARVVELPLSIISRLSPNLFANIFPLELISPEAVTGAFNNIFVP